MNEYTPCHYSYMPYIYNNKIMLIERYLFLGEIYCSPENYNIYDLDINSFALEKLDEIEQNGYCEFNVFQNQDQGLLNTFKNYPNRENKKIFLCAEIFSKTKTKIVICTTNGKFGKLWLNGECHAIHANNWNNTYYYTAEFKKGKNILLVEQYSPDSTVGLTIQIRNYYFEMSNKLNALSNIAMLAQIDSPVLVNDPQYSTEIETLRFMVFYCGKNYQSEYRIDIHDSSYGHVETFNARTNESVAINMAKLRSLHRETFRHCRIECSFHETNGKKHVISHSVFPCDFRRRAEEIINEFVALSSQMPVEIQNAGFGLLKSLQNLTNNIPLEYYWLVRKIKDITVQAKTGEFPFENYKNPGFHEVYIHSDLDDSLIQLQCRIPNNYDGKTTFPMILAFTTGNDGNFSHLSQIMNNPNDYIIFDVSGRGSTGGSYIGEASIWETIRWIFKNYFIDQERIYCLGFSNGGYATWALEQFHPGFTAAIYPQNGNPTMDNLENVSNTPVYQVMSPKDHVVAKQNNSVCRILKKYGNYTQYKFAEMLHNHFGIYLAHPTILKNLTNHKRSRWPEKVIFSTPHNRHLESFWVKLHGISYGKKWAKIIAKIDNHTNISIYLKNATGVTLTIPPQIDRKAFKVNINGKLLKFIEYSASKLILQRKKGEWEASDFEPSLDYRKGTGLLDVYLSSLRIIVPDDSPEVLRKTAENFARPSTNGWDPKAYVDYPIYEANNVPDRIFDHNLILIESIDCTNPYIRRFSDKLPVQYDELGYIYKGIRVDGKYVVMQVLPNPYDPRRSMLVITSNSKRLIIKNLFTRKVLIPFYCNGIHPYWNNMSLIFDGSRYYEVYEWGMDMKEVK